jgi:hypothetical protein
MLVEMAERIEVSLQVLLDFRPSGSGTLDRKPGQHCTAGASHHLYHRKSWGSQVSGLHLLGRVLFVAEATGFSETKYIQKVV